MIKLSLIEEKEHPEFSELIARIKAGRGGRYTYPFTLLLHSPDIAAAWLDQVTAVRWKTNLDGPLREMVIIRIGILNRVSHVSKAHGTVYAPKEGLGPKEVAAIEDWKNSELFSASQPRCVRILTITAGSSMAAMIFRVPPQFGQCSISMPKTRRSNRDQLIRAGAPCACSPAGSLIFSAGSRTIAARSPALGASTP